MKNCHWWEEEKITIVRHSKSSKKSTPPPSTRMEPRGHVRTAAPELVQQPFWLKVHTARDGQPPVTVPTTTVTNAIPCSRSSVRVTLPCSRLSYAFTSNVRLDILGLREPKLSVSRPVFTFTKAGQKWQRSLFICFGLRRWLMLCSSSLKKNKAA